MINELNITILENLLKSATITPLKKYFIWEKLKELKSKN